MNKFVIFSLSALAVTTCVAAPDLSKLPSASTQKGVTYAKDIKPLLEASCFRCHGERQHKGGLRLDSLEAALKGGEDGKVINPGDSKNSLIVLAVSQLDPEKAMPPKPRGGGGPGGRPGGPRPSGTNAPAGGPNQRPGGQGGGGPGSPGGMMMSKPLTADQVGLVRAWIDQGAK
jgi:hypothetical protein